MLTAAAFLICGVSAIFALAYRAREIADMAVCQRCGDVVEWVTVDGRRVPIHLSGRACSADASSISSHPFASTASYVTPNALCPVCGAAVFFYRSEAGGCVFFDDLGWPWPKHPCTDDVRSQKSPVRQLSQSAVKTFKANDGEVLSVYELDRLDETDGVLCCLVLRNIETKRSARVTVDWAQLKLLNITKNDIWNAPSFVVRRRDGSRIVEFISGRMKAIVSFRSAPTATT